MPTTNREQTVSIKPSLTPRILFEDPNLIILSKPAGLLSQSEKRGDMNLVDWLRNYLGRHYVGLIHRLDRNTSGIMVIAKRTKSARRLTEQLQSGRLFRSYLGWVLGKLEAPVIWQHKLQKDERTNTVRVVKQGGKTAILNAKPIRYGKWRGHSLTLVEFKLETGRSHQIRVQSSYEGHPLLGDFKYNKETVDFPRPALHSFVLELDHPISEQRMRFEDPLPIDLQLD